MPVRLGAGHRMLERSGFHKVNAYVAAVRARQALQKAIAADLGIAEGASSLKRACEKERAAYKVLTGGQLGEARRILAQRA